MVGSIGVRLHVRRGSNAAYRQRPVAGLAARSSSQHIGADVNLILPGTARSRPTVSRVPVLIVGRLGFPYPFRYPWMSTPRGADASRPRNSVTSSTSICCIHSWMRPLVHSSNSSHAGVDGTGSFMAPLSMVEILSVGVVDAIAVSSSPPCRRPRRLRSTEKPP